MSTAYNTAEEEQPSSVFDGLDAMEREDHERGIRKARNALFIVGGLMFVVDMVILAMQHDTLAPTDIYLTVGIDLAILAAFIGLGFWSKKKPYSALLTGLILFVAIQLLAAVSDPANLVRGIVVKVVVVATLVAGIKKAKRLQELNKIFTKQG